MIRDRLRRAAVLGATASALVSRGVVAQPAQAAPESNPLEKVRVNYDAPPECPNRDAFLELVRARIGGTWEAPPGELARTIDVRVTNEGGRSTARIDFVDDHGQPVTRSVGADTCPEVVSGIALVTALAIESRVGAEVKPEPAPAPPPPPPSPPPPLPAAVPPSVPRKPGAPPPHVDLGAALLVVPGIGREIAWWGPRGFVGLGWARGPDFRLGVDVAWASVAASDARFSLLAGFGEGCPWALAVGSAVRVLPCAGVIGGFVQGKGGGGSGVDAYEPDEGVPRGWFAFRALARAEAAFEVLFLEANVEGRFHTVYPEFVIDGAEPGDPDRTVYELPAASLGASLGLGLRL